MNQVKFLGLAHTFATAPPKTFYAKPAQKRYGYSSRDQKIFAVIKEHMDNMSFEALSYNFCPKRWSFERSQSKTHTTPGSKRRMRVLNAFFRSWIPPPLCLPSRHNENGSGLSPPFLHTASDQKVGDGKAWEQDYSELRLYWCVCLTSVPLFCPRSPSLL